ncbi:MAG: hypothetical protein OHK0021_04160 [Bryobacter sp.]
MKRREVFLILGAGAALWNTACQSVRQTPINFDPLSLGPQGEVLKKFLGRPLAKVKQAMMATFEASIPSLAKEGVLTAERLVEPDGRIHFEVKGFQGDDLIKKQVIARYMSGLQDSSQQPRDAVEISPQNYKFKYKRTETVGSWEAEVFEIQPRRKAVGLFKGEIWLEKSTGLVVRTAGRFVKNPSLVFRRVDFQQDFVLAAEQSLESKLEVESDTRVVGEVKMTVTYTGHKQLEKPSETAKTNETSR